MARSQNPKLRQAKYSLKQLHLCLPSASVKRSHQSSTDTATRRWRRARGSAHGSALCSEPVKGRVIPRTERKENREKITHLPADLHPLNTQPSASGVSQTGYGFLLLDFFLWKGNSKLKWWCCGKDNMLNQPWLSPSSGLFCQLLNVSWTHPDPQREQGSKPLLSPNSWGSSSPRERKAEEAESQPAREKAFPNTTCQNAAGFY